MKTLNSILNRELNLYPRTWNAYWNVKGPQFAALHELFARRYGELAALIDETAGRVRSLGARPAAGVAPQESGSASTDTMPASPAQAHGELSRRLRVEAILEFDRAGDPATEDLLARPVEPHEKAAWMLAASAGPAGRTS